MRIKHLIALTILLASTTWSQAQQINAVPDYVFRNQMSVGRNAVTDTAAYFSIGPRYGATKGFMPPLVVDTATFSSGKRNGLLIFSVQKNKFLYWDSVRVQWSDMAGSSGTYITGTGISGYVPQFNGTTTIDTSALYTLGSRLGIGTTSFAYTSATSSIELNGTSGGILGFKRNDSARGYLWHTGSDMELANTTAGSISFNTNSSTRGSISSAGVWRLHNLAGTGDRVVVASSNGTLSASTSVTGLVDTTTLSTRAWRQKGDDSLGAIIATKGSGTVTSVATGYGLSGGTITTTGTLLVDTLNISTRAWRQKGLDSLAALEVSGSGTTNYVPKFTAASTVGNSQIFDNGTRVGIGTASPAAKVDIRGSGLQDLYFISTTATNVENTIQSYFNNGGAWADLSTKSQNLIFNTGPSGGPQAERLRITSDGDILHRGTYNPLSATNRGNIMLNGSASNIIGFSNNSALRGYIFHTDSDFQFYNNTTGGRVGLYTEATARLWIQANGRIGVNTTTDAGYQLDVNGTGRFQGTLYTRSGTAVGIEMATTSAIRNSGTQYFDYGTGGSGDFYFRGGSGFANVLTLMNGGDVGIGTASPTQALSIVRGAGLIGGISFRGNNNDAANEFFVGQGSAGNAFLAQRANADLSFSTNNTTRLYIFANGRIGVNTTTDAGYQLDINGTLRSVNGANFATTSGNVGIGTTSPSELLHLYRPSAGDVAALVANTVSSNYFLTRGSGNLELLTTSGSILFSPNATTRMTLNTASELIVATTSDAGDYKLQVAGNIYNTGSAVLAATSGNVGIGVTNPDGELELLGGTLTAATVGTYALLLGNSARQIMSFGTDATYGYIQTWGGRNLNLNSQGNSTIINSGSGEVLIGTTTDAGDYKLQVVGNARVGTGKLDIASNTTFGLGVSRSGTSEVAGQIFNSNGILYTGVESSAGGAIFTGSSAYAAVIGSGANYPLQFATNNATRATINTAGELLINTLSDQGDYKLQINGSVYNTGQVTRGVINVQGTGGQVFVDSTTNISSFAGFQTLSGSNTAAFLSGNVTWNTTGNANAIDIFVTNTASGANANFMQLGDGTNNFKVTKDASIMTANPTGGTARKWRLGSAATVSPTSPNRTIQIEVEGVIYYLHAKTTND